MKFTIRYVAIMTVLLSANTSFAFDLGGMLNAGKDATKALTLTDKEIMDGSRKMMLQMDKDGNVAPASNKYGKRLAALTSSFGTVDGMKLNFKAFQSADVNAFATPDGSIRFYSGLMDILTDDEMRAVIGHEIGHVKLGHSKSQMKKALMLSAGTQAATASGNAKATAVAEIGGESLKAFANAQFSQSDETSADDYGFEFMKSNKFDVTAVESALRKLAKLNAGEHSMMSTHPESSGRADRMKSKAETK